MEQRIRAAFERWNRGDHSFDPERMHPDIEIRSVAGMLTGRIYRGPRGRRAVGARHATRSFDEWQLEIDELEESAARGGCSGSAPSTSAGAAAASPSTQPVRLAARPRRRSA